VLSPNLGETLRERSVIDFPVVTCCADTGAVTTSATGPAPIGLLLDVDGPVASPVSRTVRPQIINALIALAGAGWPVIFNTGRSDEFIREEVMKPMLTAGVPEGITFHAICEKGATWFSFGAAGATEVQVDQTLALPQDFGNEVRRLVEEKFADHMFFDETKRAMVSIEQRLDVDNEDYLDRQGPFDAAVLEIMQHFDMGVCRLAHHLPDSDDSVDYRVDPTIISTDIESVRVGKDLGADRALRLIEGDVPHTWRTVGDSRTDYAMADYLHEHGYSVAHVDVRPADGVPEKPYPVLTEGELTNDDAGAAFLLRCADIAVTSV
jgi:hydroxymethylpyrimidine pyrophosphatase-like HAD family hydrolase